MRCAYWPEVASRGVSRSSSPEKPASRLVALLQAAASMSLRPHTTLEQAAHPGEDHMTIAAEPSPSPALTRRELIDRLRSAGAGALAGALAAGGTITTLAAVSPA